MGSGGIPNGAARLAWGRGTGTLGGGVRAVRGRSPNLGCGCPSGR